MEGEKSKTESQDRCVTFKPNLEILLSAHARTSQATHFFNTLSLKMFLESFFKSV